MDDAKVRAGVTGGEWNVFLYANRTCFGCFLEGIVLKESEKEREACASEVVGGCR